MITGNQIRDVSASAGPIIQYNTSEVILPLPGLQFGRWVSRNEKERSHWMHVTQG